MMYSSDFERIYLDQYRNSSAKIAFYADEHNLNELNSLCQCSNLVLNEVLFQYQVGMGLIKNHYLFDKIDDTIQQITPFGILQYLADHHKWAVYKENNVQVDDLAPFTIDSLSFGFILWLAACVNSFVGFIVEMIHIRIENTVRTLVGLFLFLKLLNCRLKYGHYL